jgi:hypothetical protein
VVRSTPPVVPDKLRVLRTGPTTVGANQGHLRTGPTTIVAIVETGAMSRPPHRVPSDQTKDCKYLKRYLTPFSKYFAILRPDLAVLPFVGVTRLQPQKSSKQYALRAYCY